MNPTYYPIDEATARRAHDLMSFSDYPANRTTLEYRRQVDDAARVASDKAAEFPDNADKISGLLDLYSRKLAEYYNNESRIGCMCPSILVAGPANFPVRKKRKQLAAWDRNREFHDNVTAIYHRLCRVGASPIRISDPYALENLKKILDDLKSDQERMKNVNAWFRSHKSLDDCPFIDEETRLKIQASIDDERNPWRVPYPPYMLTNNNANIHRIDDRISEIGRLAENEFPDVVYDGVIVHIAKADGRIRLFFADKPCDEVRGLLKSNAFKWSPKNDAWQRQYTSAALSCTRNIIIPKLDTYYDRVEDPVPDPEYVAPDVGDTFEIWQLRNSDHAFISYRMLLESQGSLDYTEYQCVWDDDYTGQSLDDIYARFNNDKPEDYTARSVSVSDIIVIRKSGCSPEFYYVDDVGFKAVPAPETRVVIDDDAFRYIIDNNLFDNVSNYIGSRKSACDPLVTVTLESLMKGCENE